MAIPKPKDPLLLAAHAILVFFIGVLGIAAVGVLIAIPAVLFNQPTIIAELAKA